MANAAGNYNANLSDNTISYRGTGPGLYPFNKDNTGTILQQAFRQVLGKDNNNPILLPKKFVFKTYFAQSCDQIRTRCIPIPSNPNYMNSICAPRWQMIQNPDGSGKVYFLSHDEEYIIKTLQLKQHKILKKILPDFRDKVNTNKRTLLPRFFGLYSYKAGGKKIRFVVMNNVFPNNIYIDARYYLKGARTRKGSAQVCKEREFRATFRQRISLAPQYLAALMTLLDNDSMYLRGLGFTNYNLFLGVHNVEMNPTGDPMRASANNMNRHTRTHQSLGLLGHRQEGVPGQRTPTASVLLYIGIIDVLQPYDFKKQVEHFIKYHFLRKVSPSVKPPLDFQDRWMNAARNDWFR